MCYVIFDDVNCQYVTRRRNVSYPLFTPYLHKARFYSSYKSARCFAKQILRSGYHGITSLSILHLPSYSND